MRRRHHHPKEVLPFSFLVFACSAILLQVEVVVILAVVVDDNVVVDCSFVLLEKIVGVPEEDAFGFRACLVAHSQNQGHYYRCSLYVYSFEKQTLLVE